MNYDELTSESVFRSLEKQGLSLMRPSEFIRRERFDSFLGMRMDLAYRRCEVKLLMAEAMEAIASLSGFDAGAFDGTGAWNALLDAQVSGVNHGATDIQNAALANVKAAMAKAEAYMQRAAGTMVDADDNGMWATVFNVYPVKRPMFTCISSKGPLRVYDGDELMPSQYIDGDGATAVWLTLDGIGWHSLRLEQGAPDCPYVEIFEPYHFENDVMTVDVALDGRITSLRSKKSGEKLSIGNIINFNDGKNTFNNDGMVSRMFVSKGELFDIINIHGFMGDEKVFMILYLPHLDCRRIEIMTDITLTPDARAAFAGKGSSLCVEWQTSMFNPRVMSDEPFGWVDCRKGKPIYSSNAVSLSENGSGVVFDHQGIPRATASGNTLVNWLAIGGERALNDAASGELDGEMGVHRFFYAITIADDDDPGKIFSKANYDQVPFFPVRCSRPIPDRKLFCLDGDRFRPTSLRLEDGHAVLRAFESRGETCAIESTGDWKVIDKRSILADRESKANEGHPFEAFELELQDGRK